MVCRQKMDKRRLTRLVRSVEDGVVVDPTGKRNGRGAYLCDQVQCWDKALNNLQILNQALMTEITEQERERIATFKPAEIKVTEKENDTN